jgi:protein ImuB
MAPRRILSLWFPRLAAERHLRRLAAPAGLPFAVAGDRGGAQVLTALTAAAEAAGLRRGQPLRDASAMCPELLTRPEDALAEAAFLTVLRRWAGKFSPWVAEEPPDSLLVDLTGCAHLFGGEAALLAEVEGDCARLGLSVRAGIADTPGAAWALARFAGAAPAALRNGDAIEQDARATRSRAARRRGWERGGPLPAGGAAAALPQGAIAAPGHTVRALAPLPVAALRLAPEAVEGLARLGLRRVEDLLGLPRAGLARRFGLAVLKRLDQALGVEPEPVSPAAAPLHFAVRLTLPEPIGRLADVEAGLDRLLPELCARLKARARGARRVRLEAIRSDGRIERAEVGLAQATDLPARIRPLLALKLETLEAGFGFDVLRLAAPETEPLHAQGHRGPDHSGQRAGALADLVGRLGARLGAEAVVRLQPADSHLPEKSVSVTMAAFSDPAAAPWPSPRAPRPLVLFRPEPVAAPDDPMPPAGFRWRRRSFTTVAARGPERIAPEWWLDDPAWRSGVRDYWHVATAEGERLWLCYAHGGELPGGWFCQGVFA